MSAYTLDGMTAEQLRDLAQRASTAANVQEAEAAKKAQAEKDKKDIIPGVGETWKYDGRLFTVIEAYRHRVLISCDKKGKDFRWVTVFEDRFSKLHLAHNLTVDETRHSYNRNLYDKAFDAAGRLALIADGKLALYP